MRTPEDKKKTLEANAAFGASAQALRQNKAFEVLEEKLLRLETAADRDLLSCDAADMEKFRQQRIAFCYVRRFIDTAIEKGLEAANKLEILKKEEKN